MNNTILETMKQALEHIEYVANIGTSMSRDTCHYLMDESRKEANNLRAAISALEKAKPSVWISGTLYDITFNPEVAKRWKSEGHAVRGYYAHPAPTAPTVLTDNTGE